MMLGGEDMAVKAVEILDYLTSEVLGAINFDTNLPKWEVENGGFSRTYFSDRKRDHADAPFNKTAIERLCSLYRSQFGIYSMHVPTSNELACQYANRVLEYFQILSGKNYDVLKNYSAEEEDSKNKRPYIIDLLLAFLYSVEDKEYFEVTQELSNKIEEILNRYAKLQGTAGALTDAQQKSFLVEAKGKCLRCDNSVLQNNGDNVAELYEFLFLEKLPDINRSNVIVLCKNCYELLKNEISTDERQKLENKKRQLEIDARLQEEIDEIKLEEEIEEIIESLISVKPSELKKLNYEPKEVKEKIPDDFLLAEDVTGNVVKFFEYMRGLLKNLGTEKRHKDIFLADDIKRMYLSISDSPGSQQEKFDQMVNWIMNKTGSTNRKACEIIISYYIQNCEVFGINENT